MYILIDVTNHAVIARHGNYKALAALAYIQYANVDTSIIPLTESRAFSVFTAKQLESIMQSCNPGAPVPVIAKYNEKLAATRKMLTDLPHLLLPFHENWLIDQAYSIAPSDSKPYAFNPEGSDVIPLKRWASNPQQDRQRQNSSQGVHFASMAGTKPAPKPAASAAQDALPRVEKPKARSNAPESNPRAKAATGGRPKSGTSCGRIWDIADEVAADFSAASRTSKEVRRTVIDRCEAEGINKSTASVQFGKWASCQK